MINRVVLVGRLTKDPELRYTPNGVAVATFTLAVNRTYTNQQGDREADFINCVIWRRPAENVANFLKKGSLAGVEGRIQTRNYEGQDGKRVYVTEVQADSVQFLEPRSGSGGGSYSDAPQQQGGAYFGGQQRNNNQDFPFGQQQQNQQRGNNDAGYSKMNEDPFADNGQPIDISDDDLPF
ncbi:single-stranded DNA-binding protein [Domibacillus antri]|uniref:Single-stranded DNA-binding protein n=1 Tax=Domibacillus antri TaxID=1714264 RepID=A0A1Q8Q4R5_9BACI|nr:single-stranded DNA-binding protein [Domibacillus antri]OLN22318.1 single-stranded DNA-binding protein [Domibacillus antri]